MSFSLNPDPFGVKILGALLALIALLVAISFLFPLFVSVIILNYLLLYLVVLFLLLYIQHPEEKKARKAARPYSLAVLIPCYNSKRTVKKCIDSVKAMNYQLPFRVIVADDGSTDGTTKLLRGFSGIELIELPHRGKGAAMNIGLERINEDVIVCIDSDTYPEPNTLLKLSGHLDDPKIGAVTAMLCPDKRDTFIQRVQYLEYLMGFGFWNTVLSTVNIMSYVTGPLTLFKGSALKKVGYFFDTKNLAEDMDVGLRLQEGGYKIKVCASVKCETDAPDSIRKLARQRDRWYRSRVYNLIKHRRLFFSNANPNLGFFGLPYLFMVELLMIVLLLRVCILLLSNMLDWLRLNSLLVFSGNVLPNISFDFSIATQTYFFVASMAGIAIQYCMGLSLAKYRLKKSDILPLIFHVTIYPYFLALIYLIGMVKEFIGAKPVWERAST